MSSGGTGIRVPRRARENKKFRPPPARRVPYRTNASLFGGWTDLKDDGYAVRCYCKGTDELRGYASCDEAMDAMIHHQWEAHGHVLVRARLRFAPASDLQRDGMLVIDEGDDDDQG